MTLARFEHDFTDDEGNLVAVAGTVTVRREDTGALAVPYSDRDGTTGLGNPFAVSDGQVAFHVIGGSYKVTLTYGAETRELRYVAIGTAAEQDAEALGKAGYAFEFEAETTSPPSASSIRANNADLSVATKLYIDDETLGESDISASLLALDPSGNLAKNRIRLTVGAVDAVFDVDGATDQTTYVELDVSNHDGSTSLDVGTCRVNVEWAGSDIADGTIESSMKSAATIAKDEGFDTPALLLADTDLTYTASQSGTVSAGDIIKAQGFNYEVVDSAEPIVSVANPDGYHLITAGGVKLYVESATNRTIVAEAWDIKNGGVSRLNTIIDYINAIGSSTRSDYDAIEVYFWAGEYDWRAGGINDILVSNVVFRMSKSAVFTMRDGPFVTAGSSSTFIENIVIEGGTWQMNVGDSPTDCAIVYGVNCARIFIEAPQLYNFPHIFKSVAASSATISTIWIRDHYGLGNPNYNWIDIDTTNATAGAGLYVINGGGFPYAPPANPVIVPKEITGATQANPVAITCTGHNFTTGDKIRIRDVGGMTELNGNDYTITVSDANTFTLDGIDGTAYTAYTSGGAACELHWSEAYDTAVVRISGKWDTAKIVGGLYQHWAWLWDIEAKASVSFIFDENVTWDYGGAGRFKIAFNGGSVSNLHMRGGWTFTMNDDWFKFSSPGAGGLLSCNISNHVIGLIGGDVMVDSGLVFDLNVVDLEVRAIGRTKTGSASIFDFSSSNNRVHLSSVVSTDPVTVYGAGADTYLGENYGITANGSLGKLHVENCEFDALTSNYNITKPTSGVRKYLIQNNKVRDGSLPEYITTSSSTMPSSGATTTNHSGLTLTVGLRGGTITNVSKNGTVIASGVAAYVFDVGPGESWSCNYSSAPTLVYSYRD